MEDVYSIKKVNDTITAYIPKEGYQANSYFIKGTPSILIDAGLLIKDIHPDTVIVTHSHLDHILSLRYYIHRGSKLWASKKEELSLKNPSITNSYFSLMDIRPEELGSFIADRWLNDEEIITTSTTKLRVIAVPGHTPGGIALWLEKEKILFSGDTWYGKNTIGTADSGTLTELKCSVKKLKSLGAQVILPGHNPKLKFINRYGNLIIVVLKGLGLWSIIKGPVYFILKKTMSKIIKN